MNRALAYRPSPAMLVALLALFIAMGGTGYAALSLPANSVGTAQLKDRAVTSAKVKRSSLLASNFKAGQLPAGAKGATGARGAQGLKGDTGARAQGPSAADYWFVTSSSGDGTIAHQHGGAQYAGVEGQGPFYYLYQFPTDVSGCAVTPVHRAR